MAHRNVTLKDIAEHCGVCKATVSLALRRDPQLPQATVDRIVQAAADLGYDPNRNDVARRLAARKGGHYVNKMIALLLPPYFYRVPYFTEIFRGILDVMTPAQYSIIPTYIVNPLPPLFHRGEIDGIITIANPESVKPLLQQLRTAQRFGARPVVSLAWALPETSSITTDDIEGTYQATRHLLDLGHRHLAHFYDADLNHFHPERLDGIRRAYTELDLTADSYLYPVPMDYRIVRTDQYRQPIEFHDALPPDAIQRTMTDALRTHPEISAVLAPNDATAAAVWAVVEHLGMRVPHDISIVGFDDTDPILDIQQRNQLTSVHLPLLEVGQAAAHMIIAQVEGNSTDFQHEVFATRLMPRASTARPPRR